MLDWFEKKKKEIKIMLDIFCSFVTFFSMQFIKIDEQEYDNKMGTKPNSFPNIEPIEWKQHFQLPTDFFYKTSFSVARTPTKYEKNTEVANTLA